MAHLEHTKADQHGRRQGLPCPFAFLSFSVFFFCTLQFDINLCVYIVCCMFINLFVCAYDRRFSSSGKHKVRFLLPKKVPLNELIEPIVEVTDLQGNPVKSTLIKADATMPEHGHGMMTQSRPKNCAAESECQSPTGRYTFEGFRLHMPGNWLFQVELGKDDQATWRYEFEPDF